MLFISDHQTISDTNLSDVRGASEEIDLAFKTEVLSERLESNKETILVLPKRISCEVRLLDAKIFEITVIVLLLLLLQSHSYYICCLFPKLSRDQNQECVGTAVGFIFPLCCIHTAVKRFASKVV